MARYATSGLSLSAQLAGVPSGGSNVTVNGYMGYWGGSSTSGFRIRRLHLGVITSTTGAPISQNISVGVYRQTVAPVGTGLNSAVLGQPLETHTPQTDPTVGLITVSATTIGTSGATIAANPLFVFAFNTQASQDLPYEFLEELVCPIGTANGIALVNIGNTLPTSHQIRFNIEIEV